MSIRKELESATGLTPGNDPEKIFLVKLAKTASALDENAWDALSAEAQDWVNAAAKEINAAKKAGREADITGFGVEKDEPKKTKAKAKAESKEPELVGTGESEEEQEESEGVSDDEEESPKPPKGKKAKKEKSGKSATKMTTTKEPKEPKAPKEPKPAAKPRSGASNTIRRICLEHPDWKEAKVHERALKKHPDLNKNTLRGVYQSVMGVIRSAEKLGYKIVKA